jgi:hypothetical protein
MALMEPLDLDEPCPDAYTLIIFTNIPSITCSCKEPRFRRTKNIHKHHWVISSNLYKAKISKNQTHTVTSKSLSVISSKVHGAKISKNLTHQNKFQLFHAVYMEPRFRRTKNVHQRHSFISSTELQEATFTLTKLSPAHEARWSVTQSMIRPTILNPPQHSVTYTLHTLQWYSIKPTHWIDILKILHDLHTSRSQFARIASKTGRLE